MAAPTTHCPRCGTPLDAAAGACPRCVVLEMFTPEPASEPPLPEPGAPLGFVGEYELLELIGRGGMGVVYRARQHSLDRIVAVKMLGAGVLAGDEAIARFQREAAAAGGLQHPNIVPVYEIGEHQGHHYFAMEWVAGPTLAEQARSGPLPAKQAARYLHAVAEAMAFAHERGVLHRDLKSSNIILDELDHPRVSDFGLAKRIDSAPDLTRSEQMLGTPAFMAPEQADRKRGAVDVRSDVYSLGAVLYQLTTGRATFIGETTAEVLRQMLEHEPVPPRLLNPTLPRDLETITVKCLEKEPARRYPTAQDLADDLARFLDDEPIRARPVGAPERAWRWCRRRPALAASLAAVLSLLIAIAVVSTMSARRIEALRLDARVHLYASDMRLAQQAIEQSKFGVAHELLERHRPAPGDPDLRGFEWLHFWDQCRHDEVATLGRHGAQAQRVAFSPDGRLIATAAGDVRVWDAATRQVRSTFLCQNFVRALAFSPDQRRLAAANADGALKCFDLETSREISSTRELGMLPFALQWSQSDSPVELWAVGHRAAWDWRTGEVTNRRPSPVGSNRDVASDNGLLVSLQRQPWRLTVWRTNDLIAEFPLAGPALAMAAAPNGTWFAAGEFSGALNTFGLGPEARTNRIAAHRGLVNALAFSADGTRIASGGADQVIRVWDPATGQRLNELRGHRRMIWSLAFSPDGDWLVSGDASGEVKLWRTHTHGHETIAVDGRAAVLSIDGAAWTSRDTNGTRWCRADDPAGVELSLRLARDFSVVAVSTRGVLWRSTNGALQLTQRDERSAPALVADAPIVGSPWLSPDARFMVINLPGWNGVHSWDFQTGQPAWESDAGIRSAHLLAISGDSRLAAFGDQAGRLQVLELATGREVSSVSSHAGVAYAADFSRAGDRVVSAGHDGVVRLWTTDAGRLLGEYRSNVESFWSVALAPDGRRIAAGTMESTIVLWDVASRQEVATFQLGEPLQPVEGLLRFTPDGTALMLAYGTLRRWNAPPLTAR